jgi:hypothetical protein
MSPLEYLHLRPRPVLPICEPPHNLLRDAKPPQLGAHLRPSRAPNIPPRDTPHALALSHVHAIPTLESVPYTRFQLLFLPRLFQHPQCNPRAHINHAHVRAAREIREEVFKRRVQRVAHDAHGAQAPERRFRRKLQVNVCKHAARHELQAQQDARGHTGLAGELAGHDGCVEEDVGEDAACAPEDQNVDGVEGLDVQVERILRVAGGHGEIAGSHVRRGGVAARRDAGQRDSHAFCERGSDVGREAGHVRIMQALDGREGQQNAALQVSVGGCDEGEGGGEAVVEHGVGEGAVVPRLSEEVKVVEEDDDGVLRGGLVEGRGDFDDGVVCGEGGGVRVGADDGDETFGGDMVYWEEELVTEMGR